MAIVKMPVVGGDNKGETVTRCQRIMLGDMRDCVNDYVNDYENDYENDYKRDYNRDSGSDYGSDSGSDYDSDYGSDSGSDSDNEENYNKHNDIVNNVSMPYQPPQPDGVYASDIPNGEEDKYILKSEIVPPVCPACPPPLH